MALVIPWFALGFALYAVAYATAGALASRQQNADTAGQPVTYTLLAVYFAGYVALASDMDGLLANVLTVFPLTAPLVLPARSALVGVPLWEHVAAVVLVLASIYALVRFAGRIYGQGCSAAGLDSASARRGASPGTHPIQKGHHRDRRADTARKARSDPSPACRQSHPPAALADRGGGHRLPRPVPVRRSARCAA